MTASQMWDGDQIDAVDMTVELYSSMGCGLPSKLMYLEHFYKIKTREIKKSG